VVVYVLNILNEEEMKINSSALSSLKAGVLRVDTEQHF
jgi:hypothetical protein